jgi:hypothetical protein
MANDKRFIVYQLIFGLTNNYMKMTNDNKLKIVTLSHNIKALCYILDKKTFSEHCVASGTFTEIESLFDLAKELKEMNKEE